jgi:cytochrome c2
MSSENIDNEDWKKGKEIFIRLCSQCHSMDSNYPRKGLFI